MSAPVPSFATRARRLAGAMCLACLPALCVAAPPPSQALDAFIASQAEARGFSGTVLVRRGGDDLYRRSFGRANLAFDVPNRDDTRYWIASITKLFTAVLVLQQVEEGALALDGTVGSYLPDYAGEGCDRVTVQQLLHHTSGLANPDQGTTLASALANGLPIYQTPFTRDQLLQKFCSGPLAHAPGTTFDYNNADYLVLGKLLERISGMTFETLLASRILAPLAMQDTGLRRQGEIVPRLADTYFHRDDIDALVNALPVYPENWFAAGAMYSTVDDLARFSDALFGGRLLDAASMAALLDADLDEYGAGAWVHDTTIAGRPHRVLKRPGSIMGAQAQFYRLLDDDTTIVLLSNVGNTDLDAFVADIGKRALGDTVTLSPR